MKCSGANAVLDTSYGRDRVEGYRPEAIPLYENNEAGVKVTTGKAWDVLAGRGQHISWPHWIQPLFLNDAFPKRTQLPRNSFVNFGTSSMTPDNGSTEIWPGTHLLAETAGKPINQDLIEPRRASHPPAQVIAPKGGALFRDLRMWVSSRRVRASHRPCTACSG